MAAVIEVSAGIAKQRGFASRALDVLDVKRATDKAVLVRAVATVRRSETCHNCGRVIEKFESQAAGYGPICAERLGIPYGVELSDEQLDEIRARLRATGVVECWLPRAAITLVEGTMPEPSEARAPESFVVRHDGKRLVVFAPFRCKDRLKSIVGARWDPKVEPKGAWTFPGAPRTATELRLAATAAGLDAEFDDATSGLELAHDDELAAVAHKTAEELPPIPCSATDAWHHQRQAFHFAMPLRGAMLAMDMGTGKSKVAVDLVVNREHKRTLILAPKSVVGVWPKQFRLHAGREVQVCAPTRGPKGGPLNVAKRAAAIVDANIAAGDSPLVVVVNYESAWRSPMAEALSAVKWDCMILDESHRVKAPGGKASKFVAALGRRASYRLALTGTPMPHSPLDIYAQYRFVDPSIFGTSFVRFRNEYALMGGFENKQVVGYRNQHQLAERMYACAFRVEADDVQDLPPVLHEERTFALSDKAMKVYRQLDDQLVAEVEDGEVSAANALVRLLRLAQITSGRVPLDTDDPESELIEVDTGKRDLLADTIEDLPEREPIVVFCRFTQDLDNVAAVAEQQGRRYGELSGRRRDGLTDDSTMSPDVDVLGVQIQSGGVGIDLTRARYGVYYSVGFSLGDYEQSVKRMHRPGQDRHVAYYHLVAEDTVDVKVYAALRERRDVVGAVLELGR